MFVLYHPNLELLSGLNYFTGKHFRYFILSISFMFYIGNTSLSKNEKGVISKSVTEIKADRSSDRYSDYSTESNESCVLITKKKTDR